MRVVATAGHVDHGKSSLVLALTGTDPDRFPEEKARGLTIDLGFAFTNLPSGEVVGFVDVPGHVKFVKNMLAGVGAIDVALLVVAANEGWMPQTEEHVRILELLDVQHGAIALTKAGLVDDDTLELAHLDLDDHIAGTALERWPIIVVDSVSGAGVDALRGALETVLGAAPPPRDRGRPRLWVDRVFSARGAGTVVTGTLVGGAFAIDDDVVVEPGTQRARVRGIESHHDRLTKAAPGSRVALNLAGVDHHAIARGHAVVGAGRWATVDVVDVALRIISGETIARRSTLDVHVGSGQHRATVRVLDPEARFARVRFDVSLPLAVGDRFVLRSSARQTTIGGAEVLDLAPARRIAAAVARLGLPLGARLLAAKPWLRVADIEMLAGTSAEEAGALVDAMLGHGDAVRAGDWVVTNAELERVVVGTLELVDTHHREHPAEAGLEVAEVARRLQVDRGQLRAALAEHEQLVVSRDIVAMSGHRGAAHQEDGRRLLDALAASPFAPPAPAEVDVDQEVAKALVRDGAAVELDGVLFATSALDRARDMVAGAVRDRGTLTIAEIRDLLGSTRKYVMPLVNRLDAEGVTRRRGDLRIPGPRA
ncbi:MAG: selB [Actinomycetia bacterium]|nr:selB [Actinomycetes bacterium]